MGDEGGGTFQERNVRGAEDLDAEADRGREGGSCVQSRSAMKMDGVCQDRDMGCVDVCDECAGINRLKWLFKMLFLLSIACTMT